MTITSFNDFIAAAASDYGLQDTFYMHQTTVGTSIAASQQQGLGLYPQRMPLLPSLPGGKSYYAPTSIECISNVLRCFMLARLTSFGSLDISGPTFTDGSAAPTFTEGGVSRQIPSSVLGVVTTALNATPGNFTITYQDQDANSAETTASTALTASAPVGTAGFVLLNGTDWGAIDITAATRSGGTTPTGVIEFFHVWPLCTFTVPIAAAVIGSANFLTDLGRLPKLAASDSLGIIYPLATAGAIQGRIAYVAM